MISVIVPVYNVEPYLRKCLDSILAQTYRDLEILVIDDGSTDGSGQICDEYKKDERVRIFHTENKGLSAARNLGLDNATGDWIGFVDSDDWIEPDMYEVLLRKAEDTGADVVECGVYLEYPDCTEERTRKNALMTGADAIHELLHGFISDCAWDKLWKKKCFTNFLFPEGRVHEDTAITCKILLNLNTVCSITFPKYHYRQREGSLSKSHEMNCLVGYWLSNREQYEFLKERVDEESNRILRRFCAIAISRAWAHYYDCAFEDRISNRTIFIEMKDFTNCTFPLFGEKWWKLRLRIGIIFPHFYNNWSFRIAWLINHLTRRNRDVFRT